MASKQYFNFIGTATDLLPQEDKDRIAELWHAYEQILASVYQKYVEADLNIAIRDSILYTGERWLPYEFTPATEVSKAAKVRGNQDLSLGVNLATKYLFKISFNSGVPFEVDLRGANPSSTTIAEIMVKINAAAGITIARSVLNGAVIELTSPTSGPTSIITLIEPSNPAKSCIEIILGFLDSELPLTFPKFRFNYKNPYDRVQDIPELRDKIRDESVTVTLVSGVDYEVNRIESIISFLTPPPVDMWAKRTYIDDENPWNTFGFLMDIYSPNSPGYLKVLQGLWFAFWNGPKPENLKRAIYLLFGLPTAEGPGVVTTVTPTQITITDAAGVEKIFEIPPGLVTLVAAGDIVERFQPLVSGVDVFDKINRPGFIRDEIGPSGIQRFLLDEASRGPGDTDETRAMRMLEEHTFLPQISVDAFVSPDINLSNVKTFLEAIKPLHKTFLFQVIVGTFRDELAIEERLGMDIDIDVTPNLDSNQTTFLQQTDLDNYETVDDENLNLDSDGINFQEAVAIEVYSFGNLIDSFNL